MDSSSPAYRIGELARRTGVAVPTLRAWETRYRLLRPARTVGAQRLYSADDAQRVLAVLEMAASGVAIGAAARSVASGRLPVEPTAKRDALSATHEDTETAWAATGGQRSRSGVISASARHRGETRLAALPVDPEMLVFVHEATRAAVHAATPREVALSVQAFVTRIGGTLVEAQIDDAVMAVDLSFGEGPPILPRADPTSVTRLRLEQALPELIEDARRIIELLRQQNKGIRSFG